MGRSEGQSRECEGGQDEADVDGRHGDVRLWCEGTMGGIISKDQQRPKKKRE
jgi:hypothetical protein